MKKWHILNFFLICSILLSACHRDLSDPFVPKDRTFKTQFKYSSSRNRTVEKHSGFARKRGKFSDTFGVRNKSGGRNHQQSKDSYSSSNKKAHSGNRFSTSRNRVVNNGSFLSPHRREHDSFSAKSGKKHNHKGQSNHDSYSIRSKKANSKDNLASKKRMRESGVFNVKRHNMSGQYDYSGKKRQSFKSSNESSLHKRPRNSNESYGARSKQKSGEFSYNQKHKRVGKKIILFKSKDTNPGTFGGKIKTKTNSKQSSFNDKTKRIKHREGSFWDFFRGQRYRNHKKKDRELELFDPKIKHRLKLGT